MSADVAGDIRELSAPAGGRSGKAEARVQIAPADLPIPLQCSRF